MRRTRWIAFFLLASACKPDESDVANGSVFLLGRGPMVQGDAGFYAEAEPRWLPVASAGPCRLDRVAANPPMRTAISAGAITITGGAFSMMLSPPLLETRYRPATGQPWSPADTLTIQAAGADVPAFRASMAAVGRVEITRFSATPTGDFDSKLQRGQDLVVDWSGNLADVTRIELQAGLPPEPLTEIITCDFPAGTSSGTVPGALIAQAQAGVLNALAASMNEQVVDAGPYRIRLQVGWAASHGGLATFLSRMKLE